MHAHPGMATSLRLFGGSDATDAFADVSHSPLAHRFMRTLEVLRLPPQPLPAHMARLHVAVPSRFERLKSYLLAPDADEFTAAITERILSGASSMRSLFAEGLPDMLPERLRERIRRTSHE